MTKKVVITGGGGTVGKVAAEQLKNKDYDVIGVDKKFEESEKNCTKQPIL